MQDRHKNKNQYFNEQVRTVSKHVLPYLQEVMTIDENTSVLEIGCGEGGNLKPFLDLGCKNVVGVDLNQAKIDVANEKFAEYKDRAHFICGDIYEMDSLGKFDLIITRDVIEHIHDQGRFLEFIKQFLTEDGKFFMGFPPWQNPFGGHQQLCKSKFLSKLPYFHLLPGFMYKGILKLFGEPERRVNIFMEIRQTGISIDRLERLLKKSNYKKDKYTHYFINPNYETKFGLKPRKQIKLISAIPWVRNFFTTAGYYVVSVNDQ